MIPSITLNALNSGLGHFGVALDRKHIRHIDTYGAIVSESKTNIICFIRSSESEDVLNILEKSQRVSYYVGMVTHEAYNFKGDFQNSFSLDTNFLKISEQYSCFNLEASGIWSVVIHPFEDVNCRLKTCSGDNVSFRVVK